MDKMVTLFIDTMAAEFNAPTECITLADMLSRTAWRMSRGYLMVPEIGASKYGIANGNTQYYCSLSPHNEQTNFAGDSAIRQFA